MALQSEKPTRLYRCTQLELYAVTKIGITSFRENLADFAKFKEYYDTAWADQFQKELKETRKLPSRTQRGAISKNANTILTAKGDECLIAFQRLIRHTEDVWKGETLSNKLQEAGHPLYEKASKGNWEILSEMMDDGESFIKTYYTELTANKNMPEQFSKDFTTLTTEFDQLYDTFTDVGQDTEQQTTEKLTANNALYQKLINMFKDGQEIYRKDRAKQERFIFDSVLKIVRGSRGVTKQFEIPPKDKIFVERVIANSLVVNTGTTALAVAEGEHQTKPANATTLQPEDEVAIKEEGVKSITVFNDSDTDTGTFTARVTID